MDISPGNFTESQDVFVQIWTFKSLELRGRCFRNEGQQAEVAIACWVVHRIGRIRPVEYDQLALSRENRADLFGAATSPPYFGTEPSQGAGQDRPVCALAQ